MSAIMICPHSVSGMSYCVDCLRKKEEKAREEERNRILAIVDEEATHYSVAPSSPASPRDIALVFANAVRQKAMAQKVKNADH